MNTTVKADMDRDAVSQNGLRHLTRARDTLLIAFIVLLAIIVLATAYTMNDAFGGAPSTAARNVVYVIFGATLLVAAPVSWQLSLYTNRIAKHNS